MILSPATAGGIYGLSRWRAGYYSIRRHALAKVRSVAALSSKSKNCQAIFRLYLAKGRRAHIDLLVL